ncbi:hypothetical protein KFK09_021925 [Dendrobium nobile]|uniref:Aminotransferase-like plant mobile domain-containing protein n=1 Tax=Dendrobium nobile TaxID=94219 RepID=A0A8T3AIN3_DENNO|nr:hypothetical protein KFK09_021925 [Dendrobium nobile]
MSITLQDVALILGLQIDGPALVGNVVVGAGRRWASWPDCCDDLLGQHPERDVIYQDPFNPRVSSKFRMGQAQAQTCLPLRWLRWTFYRDSYLDLNEIDFWRHVRAYILFLMGTYLVPDTSGCEIHLRWNQEFIRQLPTGSLSSYRDELDGLLDSQVIWEPYTSEVRSQVADICLSGEAIWLARVPLVCWTRVEWHLPDRVVRQFGLIPTTEVQPMELKFARVDGRGKADTDWMVYHLPYIGLWEDR